MIPKKFAQDLKHLAKKAKFRQIWSHCQWVLSPYAFMNVFTQLLSYLASSWQARLCKQLFSNFRSTFQEAFFVLTSVTRCWSNKVAQMFPKVTWIIFTTVFTSIDLFLHSPKVTNLFGLLMEANLLTRTFKNRPIWSHWF